MANEPTNQNNSDQNIVDALSQMGREDSVAPSEVTRKRHLSAMKRENNPQHIRSFVAVAAAVVLVASAGVVVRVGSNESTDNARNLASGIAQPLELKKVDFITPVPFERTEDYVMLSVNADRADSIAAELSTALGSKASVIGSNKQSTTFVVPASVARTLSDTSGITVVADNKMTAIAEQAPVPSWGLDRLDALVDPLDDSYKYFSTGVGATVYVVDTGIYAGHSDFSGRVRPGYSAIDDGLGADDCNGHGTHVAGTIAGSQYGVAKNARVVAIRVLDCTGFGYSSSVVAGINWAVASHSGGAGVINLSLGGEANSAVDAAVADATAAGLVVVVAAGNSSDDACDYSPSRAPSAITIGATDQDDTQASYSNFGSCVDLYAPGTGITSTWISNSSSTRTLSGTSMASPHIAGLAARLLQAQPSITASGIRERLTANNQGGTVSIANYVEAEPDPSVTTTTDETNTTTTEPIIDSTTTVPSSGSTSTTVVASTSTLPRTTTTTLPRTSTTAPRRGQSGDKPKDDKIPPTKTIAQPKEFSLRYQDRAGVVALIASWIDDASAEKYLIKCERLKEKNDDATLLIIERSAITLNLNGKAESVLSISPKESMKCSLVAFIGAVQSKESNQAVLPAQLRRPVVTTSTTSAPPTTLAPSTTPAPSTTVASPTESTAPVPTPSPSTSVVVQKSKKPASNKR